MVKIRKYANGIERFLHGAKGQRFFNFAYSIGAAIVIWGALFKILHLPGGSTLLCIGMGTEIAMFILTAFDRPPKEYAWEDVFPVLDSHNPEDRPNMNGGGGGGGVGGGVFVGGAEMPEGLQVNMGEGPQAGGAVAAGGGGGVAVIGGGVIGGGVVVDGEIVGGPGEGGAIGGGVIGGGVIGGVIGGGVVGGMPGLVAGDPEEQKETAENLADASKEYLEQIQGMAEQMARLNETTEALNAVTGTLLGSYKAITENSETVSNNSRGYVDQMESLNRNIAGLNTIYEIQLKSISSQLESIDRVNRGLKDIRDMYDKAAQESSRYCEETEKMARYMKQLNSVYEKMITAMTINMANPMMAGQVSNPFQESINNQA